jgi:hypothetical protein
MTTTKMVLLCLLIILFILICITIFMAVISKIYKDAEKIDDENENNSCK